MGLVDIIKGLVSETKKIDVAKLPSQGFFYKDDFVLRIKKADISDIVEYEHKFDRTNLILAIDCIKAVVSKNVILSKGYGYMDIKSVDIIFVFLEIVRYTTNKDINVSYINSAGEESFITFDDSHFNYFDFNKYINNYDSDTKEFVMDGYRFSLPSIGIESSLTDYLGSRTNEDEIKSLISTSYDFMFFLGGKTEISFSEIDNLIYIFNKDLEKKEINKIKKIVDKFRSIVGYSLILEGEEIEVKSKINLQDIWKI